MTTNETSQITVPNLAEIIVRWENIDSRGDWSVVPATNGGGRVYESADYPLPDSKYPLPGCFNCGENDAIYELGDATFIAHSKEDVSDLIIYVRQLEAEIERLQALTSGL